jgi:zinc transport system ATP-binding protein
MIGYVPQHAEFDNRFPISVWDVVLMGRRSIRGNTPFYTATDKQQTMQALHTMEMQPYAKRHISKLSGGQRQRVFIARALASEPKILLLDEPTASIDKEMQENIYHFLKELNKEMTIVLITHDIGVLSSNVGRIACLNRYLFSHDDDRVLSKEMIEAAYSCPVELIAHGVPHRVLENHPDNTKKRKTRAEESSGD